MKNILRPWENAWRTRIPWLSRLWSRCQIDVMYAVWPLWRMSLYGTWVWRITRRIARRRTVHPLAHALMRDRVFESLNNFIYLIGFRRFRFSEEIARRAGCG